VLHCLGVCMLLWPIFRKLPHWALALLGLCLAIIGLYLLGRPGLPFPYLMPLGLPWSGFSSSDYFPLLPYFGFFLIGCALGRSVYRKKQSLLPKVNANFFLIRFLTLCGKHSLWIYLLHQPLLSGIFYLIMWLQPK